MPAPVNGVPRGRGGARGGRGRGMARGSRVGILGGSAQKAGPRPARHIPWPEIFRHHISLVEGHLKMIDMVRKHTVEGSGNHRTIVDLVTRANDMLRDAKLVQREFVAPKDAWKEVPIGSSSDTMYPGYSPKHHEYGKAAEEFGKMWSEAKKKGVEFNTAPDGPEYQFGQGKAAKRRRLSGNETADSGAEKEATSGAEENVTNGTSAPAEEALSAGNGTLFFFDSNPTPNGATPSTEPPKKKPKKLKESLSGEPVITAENLPEPELETANIDAEVDARLRLKADAKNKKDKKRKRESAASNGTATAATTKAGNEEEDDVGGQEKPPKKKNKSKKDKKRSSAEASPAPEIVAPAETSDVEMEDVDVVPVSESIEAEDNKTKKDKKGKKEKKHKKREGVASTEDGGLEDVDKKKKKKAKKEKSNE